MEGFLTLVLKRLLKIGKLKGIGNLVKEKMWISNCPFLPATKGRNF
jgi:hypothetical protein